MKCLGRKSIKIESDESQCEDNSNSDSEISLEKIRSDVLSSFIKNKKRRLEGLVRHTSSSKIYVVEMYWQDTSINQTNQLPFDIDGNCIFEIPFNTDKRFGSTKDGRYWGPLRESKRSGFSGDRYIATCRGSFECHNENCPYLIEFKKVNRRQFNLKGLCKSCCYHSKRTSCEARKFWEFPLSGEKVFVKHFGQHSCSPVNPRRERDIPEAVKKHSAKGVSARKDILCSMLRKGKELSEVESKADQILDCVILSSTTSKGNTDFSKLIAPKERYKKDDPFLIYKLDHLDLNNQPTYVFKTSSVSVDTGKKLDRVGDHYLSSSYVHFDGNEKRVNSMTTLTLPIFHPLIRNKIILATLNCEGENKENAELFWRCLEEALMKHWWKK